jgi:hypothetical protein
VFQYYGYENSGDIVERILGYNYRRVEFVPNDNGDLYMIRSSSDCFLTEKIGDYPIMTAAEAKSLLLGKYFDDLPGQTELRSEDPIAHLELIYRYEARERIFAPYYQIYVELPDSTFENGLKPHAIAYMLAIRSEYQE